MKKYFYSIFAATTMLMAASCSQDELVEGGASGNEEVVTFTVNAGVVTRAAGDGNTVNKVHYEVWDKNTGKLVISTIPTSGAMTQARAEGVSGGRANVSMSLVKGVPYDITFWAQNEEGTAYDISAGLDDIKLKGGLKSNQEAYDAFFKTVENFKVKNGTTTVELKRPFAQVNIGTAPADWQRAIALGVKIDKSTVTVSGVHNQFNARTAEATGKASVTFDYNALLNETFEVKDSTYQYLAMNYLLADVEKSLHNLDVTFNVGDQVINNINIANMPIQRNWRTNIVGRLLTSDEDFVIIIDEEFDNDHNISVWGGDVEEVVAVDGVYTINEASQLAWIAQQVNSGANNFKDATVVLAADLDLNNHVWTPIGTNPDSKNHFEGTFDGQGHVIYNLYVKLEPAYVGAGLFGASRGTIKNFTIENAVVEHEITGDATDCGIAVVAGSTYATAEGKGVYDVTVKNAVIKGNRYVGGIVGYADGVIENCVVEGLNIVVTPNKVGENKYDNGDKIGGIVGYTNSGIKSVKGNSVKNVTMTGYRDLGGIAGAGKAEVFADNAVETATITVDQLTNSYGAKDANAAAIVGRVLTGTVADSNTESGVTINYIGVIMQPAYDAATKTWTITNGAELLWVAAASNGEVAVTRASAGDSFSGETILLANDIDLAGQEWAPLGYNTAGRFCGNFDGNNMTIKNFKITKANAHSAAAFFGVLGGNSTIKNLTIDNATVLSNITSGETNFYGAGLAAVLYGEHVFENITVQNSRIQGSAKTGGLIGFNGDCAQTITNCKVVNTIIESTNPEDGGNIGGLVGFLQSVGGGSQGREFKIENSSVEGCTINAYNSANAGKRANGKFVGGFKGEEGWTLNFANCYVDAATVLNEMISGTTYVSPYDTELLGGTRLETAAGSVVVDGEELPFLTPEFRALQDAVEKGGTVKMTEDVVASIPLEIPMGKTVTLDMDGKTITGTMLKSVGAVIKNEGTLKIVGGTVSSTAANGGSAIANYGTLTIEGTTLNGAATREGESWPSYPINNYADLTLKEVTVNGYQGAVACNSAGRTVLENCNITKNYLNTSSHLFYITHVDAEVIVNGGNYVHNGMDGSLAYVNRGKIIVNDGTFTTSAGGYGMAALSAGIIEINGGTFDALPINWGGQIVVKGGSFSKNPKSFVSEGFEVQSVGGNYVVIPATPEGTTAVFSADNLIEGLEEGNDVILYDDVNINPAGMSNAYGTTGINVKNGQTIDGNGHILDIKGAGGTWDSGINTTGGLIKNITVTGSFRGIFINHNSTHSEKVVLDNVTIDGTTYTISCDQGMNQGLEATNSTFKGWTSYAATLGNAKFTGCYFGEGNGYAYCRPYAPTEFVNCEFAAGFELDARAAVTFENCKLGGVALTAENLATLVTSNIANATVK